MNVYTFTKKYYQVFHHKQKLIYYRSLENFITLITNYGYIMCCTVD